MKPNKVAPSDEGGDVESPPYCPYGVNQQELYDMNDARDMEKLKSLGGINGLAQKLKSDLHKGLVDAGEDEESVEAHRKVYGINKYQETPPKSFFELVWGNLQDPVIIILCFAALVSTILGASMKEEREKSEWIEGVAIWIAVILVVSVSAGNDYQKDKQFRKLNAQKDKIMVKALRGGHVVLVENTDLVVGDIYVLDTGDKVVADGIVVASQGLVLDEAALTGESDPIKKHQLENGDEDCWVRSGTQVSEGSGRLLIIAVGDNSEWGKTLAMVGEAGDEETPLQEKLTVVASTVGKVGFGVAIACFIALLIKWCVSNKGFPIKKINDHGPIQFFLFGVTIIVVAVPEGLPLAVTISLAYSMKKMMLDNNFVRVLAACETMGGATAICSDKTGTLTENRMSVVEGWFAGKVYDHLPTPDELPGEVANELKLNAALNSKAFLMENNGKLDLVGNRTECALLLMLRSWSVDYEKMRSDYENQLEKMYGFSSAKKMASVLIKFPEYRKYRLYNKGAAEWVLKRCINMYNEEGQIVPVGEKDRAQLLEVVTGMAKRGLRCICLTFRDMPLEDPSRPSDFFEDSDNCDKSLTALAIVGIKDPVRKEVPEAVRVCQGAGITVRMVTGDNIHTAQHIARECGILTDNCVALEGPVFRDMPAHDLLPMLPNLRVLARSSPEDKLNLVRMLKQQGEVVAVTGDGTNDAPALKESHVGLAMGIAGTEVAKEAADIVILDDNFSSIVKSVLWGRSVFTNIRKFLMFQLTVNLVALVISFFGAVIGGQEPLNVLQLLWVNLIMDTMGALALATENPTPELLQMKPYGKNESLITKTMWKHIFVQGSYQLFWLFFILYAVPNLISRYHLTSKEDYYNVYCTEVIQNDYPTDYADLCNVMNSCGFPYGDRAERYSNNCVLYQRDSNFASDDELRAVCGVNANATSPCDLYNHLQSARDAVSKKFKDHRDDEYVAPLSVLFNAFIFCQVFNEINARRINDEYTIFQGLGGNVIFLGVLAATVLLQVIIINVPGINKVFKVQRLDWHEWLATIAMGMGSIPLSLLTRFVSKNLDGVVCLRGTRMANHNGRTISGRSTSGRLNSAAKSISGRSASGSEPPRHVKM